MHYVYGAILLSLTYIHKMVRSNYRLWRFFTRLYIRRFDRIGYFFATLRTALAYRNVPAYRHFVQSQTDHVVVTRLQTFPETNKENYVKRYPVEERCAMGTLKIAGTVVDESSGSSGVPMNWVRSRSELQDVHLDTANYIRLRFPSDRLFTINAFSMGAWATGTNTGIALAKVGMVKSTGPDLDKVLDTLLAFGPSFDYIITGYPPFLKHFCDEADARDFPWDEYTLYGFVGGEAMTEALRTYLQQRFERVYSAYGATDLQIGVGVEFDFTIWLRQTLLENRELRERVLGPDEQRLPMIFQYNPLDNYIEINEKGELVVTMNNLAVMCPRLRYNIGDEGRVWPFDELADELRACGYRIRDLRERFAADFTPFPLLLIYGRKDSTISYMGANIYPQDVEYGLYQQPEAAAIIESFCLTLEESADLEGRVTVHIEMRDHVTLSEAQRRHLRETYQAGIVAYLASVNRDFAQSLEEDPTSAHVQIRVEDYGAGVFATRETRIKNQYLLPAQSATKPQEVSA